MLLTLDNIKEKRKELCKKFNVSEEEAGRAISEIFARDKQITKFLSSIVLTNMDKKKLPQEISSWGVAMITLGLKNLFVAQKGKMDWDEFLNFCKYLWDDCEKTKDGVNKQWKI